MATSCRGRSGRPRATRTGRFTAGAGTVVVAVLLACRGGLATGGAAQAGSVEGRGHSVREPVQYVPRESHRAGEREEAVNGSLDREVLDRHACVGQLAGVAV